jgi:hypothetical protein
MSATRDPAPLPGQRRPSGQRGRSARNGATQRPTVEASYRRELSSGEDTIDPSTWAGSMPVAYGIAPRVRVGRSRWFNLLWLLPTGFVLLIVAIATAKGLRNVGSVRQSIAEHPGTVASSTPHTAALPIWVGVQHFFHLFLVIFIIRSGLQILTDHPRLYWTRHSTPRRYDSRLRHIGLGRAHHDKPVIALIADRYIRIIDAETGELLRELTLDPNRDYQPQKPV